MRTARIYVTPLLAEEASAYLSYLLNRPAVHAVALGQDHPRGEHVGVPFFGESNKYVPATIRTFDVALGDQFAGMEDSEILDLLEKMFPDCRIDLTPK